MNLVAQQFVGGAAYRAWKARLTVIRHTTHHPMQGPRRGSERRRR